MVRSSHLQRAKYEDSDELSKTRNSLVVWNLIPRYRLRRGVLPRVSLSERSFVQKSISWENIHRANSLWELCDQTESVSVIWTLQMWFSTHDILHFSYRASAAYIRHRCAVKMHSQDGLSSFFHPLSASMGPAYMRRIHAAASAFTTMNEDEHMSLHGPTIILQEYCLGVIFYSITLRMHSDMGGVTR